jgi:hypothetical protein
MNGTSNRADRQQARLQLGLPFDQPILLFVANGIKNNPFGMVKCRIYCNLILINFIS